MKKKILTITIAAVLVAVLVLTFVGCTAKSYREKLEDADYTVTYTDKDSDGYESLNNTFVDSGYEGGIVWQLYGAKLSITKGVGGITIIKFKKISDAKEYEENSKLNCERTLNIVFVGDDDSIAIVK